MPKESVYSVSQITFAIKQKIECMFSTVQVQGEVTNLRQQSSGHVYFTLKDQNAQISVALFSTQARQQKVQNRLKFKEGDNIIVEGKLGVYAPRGSYQLIATHIHVSGVGTLLMKLHALKEELSQKGWFAEEIKKKIPAVSKTIGVVTSPSGAVIQDILHILEDTVGHFHLILYPAKVQGDGACDDIAKAITDCNAHKMCDVLIVARGGGSLEDLFAFNERVVAEAIYRSTIPVISAVGHETDFSIADFVADVRAPTPSRAAQLVVQERISLKEKLGQSYKTLQGYLLQKVQEHRSRLNEMQKAFCRQSFLPLYQRIDLMEQDLSHAFMQIFQKKKQNLLVQKEKFKASSPLQNILLQKEKILHVQKQLDATNPKNILQKGYCICLDAKTNRVLTEKKSIKPEQKVTLQMHDGNLSATINQSENYE